MKKWLIGITVLSLVAFGCLSYNMAQDETSPPATEKPVTPTPPTAVEPKPAEPPRSPDRSVGADETPPPKPEPSRATAPTGNPAPLTELKIGVVNIQDVFQKYKKTKEYEERLQKDKDKEMRAIGALEDKIKTLLDEIGQLDATSNLRRENEQELERLKAEREYRVKSWNKFIKSKVDEQTAKLYKDIREAIGIYAQENNYALVFKTEPMISETETEDSTEKINLRAVLYHHKSLDITEAIIKLLNRE
ncbi:MAG: OmpH family outer membrane protein [Planctomycetes bacterium]|nr:OmpH family outer membrane protein [Planctomycetota bacterium]